MIRLFACVVAAIALPKYPILLPIILTLLYGWTLLRRHLQGGQCKCNNYLEGKVALITGGNAGIGMATAKLLAKKGCKVIITCRNMIQGKNVIRNLRKVCLNQNIECMQLDLSKFASIKEFANNIATKEKKIDFLICNAGVGWKFDSPNITEDGQELIFQTNYLGHFMLVNLLWNLLNQSENGRVISVGGLSYLWPTSIIPYDDMKWENNQWNPLAAYGQSNLARVLFTREISRRAKLNGDKITSYVVHPGIVATGFNQRLKDSNHSVKDRLKLYLQEFYEDVFFKTPESGAQTILHCCLSPELSDCSGRFYMDCKELPYEGSIATDRDEAIKLWDISQKIVGDICPISSEELEVGDSNSEWKYVGRKRRTAL